MRNKENPLIRLKKYSKLNAGTRQVFDASGLKYQPLFQKKSVVK